MNLEECLARFTSPVPVLEKIRRDAKAKGLHLLSMRALNREIKAYRLERRKQA